VTALEPLAKVVARILLLGLVVLLDGVAALAAHLGRLLHLDTADWAAQFQLMQRQIVEQPPYDSEVVPGTTAPWAVALLRLGLLTAVVGLAAVWLSRAAARYTRGAVAEEGVEGELALSRARIVADAAALARSVAAGARSAVRRLGRGEGQGVRGAYRSFLSAMAAAGWVRPPSATPFEFEAIGRQVVPEEGPAVVDLTAAYVRARYGVAPAGGDVAGRARAAWRRIRSALEAREV
ncbi:MAG: DUF4129 domain-containing protein, partial [Anaerolineae bacterium]